MKIITAMNNPELNEELKKEKNIEIYNLSKEQLNKLNELRIKVENKPITI